MMKKTSSLNKIHSMNLKQRGLTMKEFIMNIIENQKRKEATWQDVISLVFQGKAKEINVNTAIKAYNKFNQQQNKR
jgi:hypothetical protein